MKPRPSAQEAAPAKRMFRVEFAKTRRVIECPEDMFVLEAARKAGHPAAVLVHQGPVRHLQVEARLRAPSR